ncbi:MAG: hypothetical protein LDL41_16380 [Coleofasciculus sp. S288]|nr:hypothetical protein [Coleofasciculus sp. S288]
MEEVDDQLAYHELQIKKLKQKREQLQQLYEEQQEAGEDDSEPVETDE